MKEQEFFITSENVKMPKIIYGTAWKKEKTTDYVIQAVKLGFRGIDTACQPKHYSEKLVGDALLSLQKEGIKREDIFLQTKFTSLDGQDPNQISYDKTANLETQVAQSFETSQKNLHTNYVDSLVLHSPMNSESMTLRVWKAMEKIYEEKGAKQLGISNCYDLKVLKSLHKNSIIKPAVIQNRFYKSSNYDKELRTWCDNNDIIYQSFWTLSANPNILESKEITSIAKKLSKTSPQILFRFLTQIGIAPLTGTCSEQHIKEDLSIFEFELSKTEIEQINKLF
ncbi:MAG: aldo/keto reductase [Cyanobacteriota bacterium]